MKQLNVMKPREFTGLKILEALAATGLRSVRYCKEIGTQAGHPDIKVEKILANDWDPEAAKIIKKNFDFNGIDCEQEITSLDATDLMYSKKAKKDWYDVVDLDPYGTAVPFLDSAL